MKKLMYRIALAGIGLSMIVIPAGAADYSSMTTEELAELRGTMQNATQEEHAAFQQEWQNRLRHMTREERQRHIGPPADAPRDGSGMQYGGKGNGDRQRGDKGGRGGGPGGNR